MDLEQKIYKKVVYAIERLKMSDYQPISDYVAEKLSLPYTEESRDLIYSAISTYNDLHDTEY